MLGVDVYHIISNVYILFLVKFANYYWFIHVELSDVFRCILLEYNCHHDFCLNFYNFIIFGSSP